MHLPTGPLAWCPGRCRATGGAATVDATRGGVPPRTEDLFRHLDDLRTNSFEGAGPRAERVELFGRSVELLGPVVRRVLDDANTTLLDGTGEIDHHGLTEQSDGGWTA